MEKGPSRLGVGRRVVGSVKGLSCVLLVDVFQGPGAEDPLQLVGVDYLSVGRPWEGSPIRLYSASRSGRSYFRRL